jgi:CheY-like chemotaxis protein
MNLPRILVAEDDEDINVLLLAWLKSAGYEAVGVGNGAEAVATFCEARASARPFALLLLDICMPHMDGDAAALAVRYLDDTVPIIFLTGYGPEARERDRVRLVHHSGVIDKPVELSVLKTYLGNALAE